MRSGGVDIVLALLAGLHRIAPSDQCVMIKKEGPGIARTEGRAPRSSTLRFRSCMTDDAREIGEEP